MPTFPLQHTSFKLDFGGVAGFFGGEEAIAAMSSVHIRAGTKWLGWYNSPGSSAVARKYGQLSNSRVWRSLFPGTPGTQSDPTSLFDFYGRIGPQYVATHSGSAIPDTGHVGNLFTQMCQSVDPTQIKCRRETVPGWVTVAALDYEPDNAIDATIPRRGSVLLAAAPILCSWAACAICAVYGDWFVFAMLLLGILSNGLSCLAIGSGTLKFLRPIAAGGSPRGDGVMYPDTRELIVVLGKEDAVNSVTKGRFQLRFSTTPEEDSHVRKAKTLKSRSDFQHSFIGLASVLLTAQFLLQLLLIPQGTLFGQMLFLITLAISWSYNSYLASFERKGIVEKILGEKVLGRPSIRRFQLGTRTAVLVFAALVLQSSNAKEQPNAKGPPNAKELTNVTELFASLPDTEVWEAWKENIGLKLETGKDFIFLESDTQAYPQKLAEKERNLLRRLYSDAEDAWKGYMENLHVEDHEKGGRSSGSGSSV